MHWLSRNSSQSSSSPSTKPTRISEPKLIRSADLTPQPRSGTLGSGATVVRTPDEALRTTGVRITFEKKPDTGLPNSEEHKVRNSVASQKVLSPVSLPSPATSAVELSPTSPPVPLPKTEVEGSEILETIKPPRSTRASPSVPPTSLRSSLKVRPVQQVEDVTTIPPLPAHLSTAPTPPPFRPTLVSEAPTGAVDDSQIIVILETSTASHKTTLETLKSPLGSPDAPETLPRSIQMLSSNQRLESLLELRDEAAYLGLEGLCKLCVNEIRLRHGLRLHTRGQSTSTVAHSMETSFHNLHALLESVESDIHSNPRNSRSSGSTSTNDSSVDMTVSRSLPTPQSWNESSRRRSEGHSGPSTPAGWI
ncbi:hypothetical protein C0992_004246 [Termitomyces sp. T32_za158]|nr:hypothetical protein C0992_004246 [Termitomyces sp. T32_za158]